MTTHIAVGHLCYLNIQMVEIRFGVKLYIVIK